MKKIKINGTGCSLVDYVYLGIDFSSDIFRKYASKKDGDGGISPGKLVFTEEFEAFSAKKFSEVLTELTASEDPDSINIGGPSIVALIHAAQLLYNNNTEVSFYGYCGDDKTSEFLFEALQKTPINIQNYKKTRGHTPYTMVLSDPNYNNGEGERAFVNNIGAAWNFNPESLSSDFFDADIILYGGTGLVPNIHDKLHLLLKKGRGKGGFSIVSTVYDFRNEKLNPGKSWPLGDSELSFPLIDLLITDHEEALRISGQKYLDKAAAYFIDNGISAFIITNGAQNISIFSNGEKFQELSLMELPVSEAVTIDLQKDTGGDTTGCGDNFVGGVLTSIAMQFDKKKMDLVEAASWGIASGGLACFYLGGTYFEEGSGEKFKKVSDYYKKFKKQNWKKEA